jgi:Ca2+-transporting ATPase
MANIGIAMGERGTDVAREAAHLVLTHDDFGSILNAIRIGRQVRQELNSALDYLFTIHLPLVVVSILPVAFPVPMILLPVHLAFLHLLIEPVSSVAFGSKEVHGSLKDLPAPAERLFRKGEVRRIILRGMWVFISVFLVFLFAWFRGKGEWDTRGLSLTTLVFANSALILREGLKRPGRLGRSLWISLLGPVLFLILVSIPAVRGLFKMNSVHFLDAGVCLAMGLLGGLLEEALSRQFAE